MGTLQRRRREAAARRKAILSAARKRFFRQGYARTTMPQIAKETELAPGTLYLYFPSKDALYVELLYEGYDALATELEQAVASADSPADQAAALIDAFFTFATERPEYFDIVFFLLQREGTFWEQEFPKALVEGLYARMQRCKSVAADVLRADGRTDEEAVNRTVEAVWSMMSGVLFHFRQDQRLAEMAAEAKRTILAGVFSAGRPGEQGLTRRRRRYAGD